MTMSRNISLTLVGFEYKVEKIQSLGEIWGSLEGTTHTYLQVNCEKYVYIF